MRIATTTLLVVLLFLSGYTQQNKLYSLDIQCIEDVKLRTYKTQFRSQEERKKELNSFLAYYHKQGFLAATVEKLDTIDGEMTAFVSIGKEFSWAEIRPGNVAEELLEESGWNKRHYRDKPLRISDVANIHSKLLTYFENHGYPFASIRLDSVEERKGTIAASLFLEKGDFFTIDSVLLKGNVEVAQRYIENYISVKSGDAYNESVVRAIDKRLLEIPFLSPLRPIELVFSPGKVQVHIYIEKKKSSDINAIVGLVPDEVTNKINWIGDARLRLKNALSRGELIDFNVRRMLNLTTDLKFNFNYPFIFDTDFGSDFLLKVYRKDTTFLEVQRALALQYLLSGGNFLEIFIDRSESSLLSNPAIITPTVLSKYGDVAITSYGLGVRKEKYNYKFNPQKGYGIQLRGSVGNKLISKNDDYPDALYANIDLKSTQFRIYSEMDLVLPIKRKTAIYMKGAGGTFMNSNILQNELYRIGGLHTLRGFDVETIFATTYGIFTLEYRYLLEQNSRWYVFTDIARYEKNIVSEYTSDTPIGFGTGVSFETGAGIFTINYALGSQQGNPILLRASRVHFGFVNFF